MKSAFLFSPPSTPTLSFLHRRYRSSLAILRLLSRNLRFLRLWNLNWSPDWTCLRPLLRNVNTLNQCRLNKSFFFSSYTPPLAFVVVSVDNVRVLRHQSQSSFHPVVGQTNRIFKIHRKFQFSPKTKIVSPFCSAPHNHSPWQKNVLGVIGTLKDLFLVHTMHVMQF